MRNSALYIGAMSDLNTKSAVEVELKRLEKRLEDLIATVNNAATAGTTA